MDQPRSNPTAFHLTFGTAEIHAFQDGVLHTEVGKLYRHLGEALAAPPAESPGSLSVNCFLIRDGKRHILVDTGSGQLFGPEHGKLPNGLAAIGLTPADIDHIILTHIHADHTGGLVQDGKPVFPKAIVHAGKTEAGFWLAPGAAERQGVSERVKGQIGRAHLCLDPYEAEGRLAIFEDEGEVLPGFTATLRAGHTPGHLVIRTENAGKTLLFVGDIVHGDSVQFRQPEITIDFDYDQVSAAQARALVFEEAAQQQALIAAAHLPYPGIGFVKRDGEAFRFDAAYRTIP
ncbi:MBL fold metallo-hydrolase [Rhizobium paknamense]|uniref:Glyoxylase-like metal-dependent hydrolase (Beta-lactamase superfamily II) n=1 Tax=Rhizobium paknamense TaxID=1206817 RepID=A0ABU0IA07_9HYPH|nr:MBL fold metallo-hydrolase [Rhizobium paknamense]MDQ0454478.1 glyoxylase-like metal-dependent hydrolase (beta-lactamase superfamily II) [Rhizobium paknamense]